MSQMPVAYRATEVSIASPVRSRCRRAATTDPTRARPAVKSPIDDGIGGGDVRSAVCIWWAMPEAAQTWATS